MTSKYRSLSFWHDSVPGSLSPRQSLEDNTEADVAIVGGGYTGLWTAYYLKQIDPSLDIAILEAEIAGFGASGRNGGWCAAYLSGIDHWLENPKQHDSAMRLKKLMFDTVMEVGRVSQREAIDCHFERSGTLEIAVNKSQVKRAREDLEHQRSLGFTEDDYRWLDQQEIAEALSVDKALGAIHMSHTAAIHPARLARGLAETLENCGVRIYEHSPVVDFAHDHLTTDSARVRARRVILACEGYSDNLPGIGRRLVPMHSMMIVTEPLSDKQIESLRFEKRYTFGNLDHMVTYGQFTADRRIAFGCRGSYHYGSGIKQFSSDDPEFEVVRETLLRFFPDLRGIGFTHAWGGAMGVTRSLQPSVNYDPNTGLGWAGGYFGNGVAAANLAGRTMADLIMGRDTERIRTPWVNPPGPSRKWEPEPIRWLGIKSRTKLMQLADVAEYRDSVVAPAISKTLDTLFP